MLINRKSTVFFFCAAVIPLLFTDCSERHSTERLNILFIMSDDHAANAIGAYDSRFATLDPTPNLDKLADEGMLFENMIATNSICSPSRACILTGQYNHINGVEDLYGVLPETRQYLAHEMRRAGYQTSLVGKWHMRTKPSAFDWYYVLPGQGKYHDPFLYNNQGDGETREQRFDSRLSMEVIGKTFEGHSSDVITDLAMRWFREVRDPETPFFMMLHYKAPHDMYQYAPRYEDYLADVEFPDPENLWDQTQWGSVATRGRNDSLRHIIGSSIGRRNSIRTMGSALEIDDHLDDTAYKRAAYQEYMRRYFRCVKGIDDNLGRLFDLLEAESLMDNTVIMYTSDQGLLLGEHDLQDKRWMYEESIRMPLLVRHPKMVAQGTRCTWLCNNTDFAPTILELAGVPRPVYMQGMSFADALRGNKKPTDWRTGTYYRYWMHMAHNHGVPAHFGWRTERYKLIFYYGSDYMVDPGQRNQKAAEDGNRYWMNTPPGWELYDLQQDPNEDVNVYRDPEYAGIIDRLKKELEAVREEIGESDEAVYPQIQDIIEEHWND
jgi:uncharacterized sulfatase